MNIKKIFNNKGVTLIEMIMVLAISVVLVVIAGFSLSLLNSANTMKSASSLKAVLSKAKTQSMAKGNVNGQITIKRLSSGTAVVMGESTGVDDLVAGRRVESYYYFGTGNFDNATKNSKPIENLAGFTLISSDIKIQYNSAGMVTSVLMGGTDYRNDTYIYEFAFKSGKRVDAVVLYPVSGKVETLMWFE